MVETLLSTSSVNSLALPNFLAIHRPAINPISEAAARIMKTPRISKGRGWFSNRSIESMDSWPVKCITTVSGVDCIPVAI